MKNKVLLIGGSLFTTMKFNENEFVPIYNSFVNKLNLLYDCVNVSVEDKGCEFHYSILSKILECDTKFKTAYLYVGEHEALAYNLDTNLFYNNYAKIIELLLSKHINIELYLLDDDNNNIKINNVIRQLANDYNLNLNNEIIKTNTPKLLFCRSSL